MEKLIPYIPAGIVVAVMVGLSVKLKDHPTWKDVTAKDVCDEKHKAIDDKLNCIPEMKDALNDIKVKMGQIEVLLRQRDDGK